jgi:small subunit ribosomal protein S9
MEPRNRRKSILRSVGVAEVLAIGTGRRKTAVARVCLKAGKGQILVNGRELDSYFPREGLVQTIKLPMAVTDNLGAYDVKLRVKGGGISSQAGACRHGLARALVALDDSNRPVLRANGFLRRDSRMVERKKYGKRGARRRFQFSKR